MATKPAHKINWANYKGMLKLVGAISLTLAAISLVLYMVVPGAYLSGTAIAGGAAITFLALMFSGDLPLTFGYQISGNRNRQRFTTGVCLIVLSVVFFMTDELPQEKCTGTLNSYEYVEGSGQKRRFVLSFHCNDGSTFSGRFAPRSARDALRAEFDAALANTSQMNVWASDDIIHGLSVDGVWIRDPKDRTQDREDFAAAMLLAAIYMLLLAASGIRIRRYNEGSFVHMMRPMEAHELEGRDEDGK